MPVQAGIHDFPGLQQRKSWMAVRSLPSGLTRGAAMTGSQRRCVNVSAGWYYTNRLNHRPVGVRGHWGRSEAIQRPGTIVLLVALDCFAALAMTAAVVVWVTGSVGWY